MGNLEIDISKTQDQPKIKVRGGDPIAENSKKIKESQQELKDLVNEVDGQIDDIKTKREEWRERQIRYYKHRFGIRNKKSFPWPGCSNTQIMTVDKSIRKLRPSYVNLAWTNGLLCQFVIPKNEQMSQLNRNVADYNSSMLDHIIREKMPDSFKKIVNASDTMLQDGFSLIKVTYEYKTGMKEYEIDLYELNEEKQKMIFENTEITDRQILEFFVVELNLEGMQVDLEDDQHKQQIDKNIKKFRDGKTDFQFKFEVVIKHHPKWTVCKNEEVYVHGVFNDVEDSTLICHEMKILPNDLRKCAASGKFDADVVEEILNSKARSNSSGGSSVTSEGDRMKQAVYDKTGSYLWDYDESYITIREVYCYADPDKSKINQRCILTYCPDFKEAPLKFCKLPFKDGKWPFVKMNMDYAQRGWLDHRGIPAQLDYYSTNINVKHNQGVDLITLMFPMLEYEVGSTNLSNVRYIPGQGIPVTKAGSVRPISTANASAPAYQFIQDNIRFLKHEIEDYISAPDFTLTDPNAPGAKNRTATEILTKARDREGIFSLDADIYLDKWQEVLEMTWSRWMQYGEESYELTVMGQENPIKWAKSQGYLNFAISPAGSAQEVNPILKARQFEMYMMLMNNPVTGPMMKVNPLVNDISKMVNSRWYDKYVMDQKEWDTWKQQQQQMQQMQAQSQAQQQQQALQMDVMKTKAEYDHDIELERVKGENDVAAIVAKARVQEGDDDAKKN